MSLSHRISFANQTVTRLRALRDTDRYGNEWLNWAETDELDITGCTVQPRSGDEEQSFDADAVTIRHWVDAPIEADITAQDRVRYDDDEYQVDGPVQRWRSPTGRVSHAELTIARVERD